MKLQFAMDTLTTEAALELAAAAAPHVDILELGTPLIKSAGLSAVTAIKDAGLSQRQALGLAGMSRSSWHYRTSPRPRVVQPLAHTQRRSCVWLSERERSAIRAKLEAAFAEGRSVYHGFYTALDAGDPVASISSW